MGNAWQPNLKANRDGAASGATGDRLVREALAAYSLLMYSPIKVVLVVSASASRVAPEGPTLFSGRTTHKEQAQGGSGGGAGGRGNAPVTVFVRRRWRPTQSQPP